MRKACMRRETRGTRYSEFFLNAGGTARGETPGWDREGWRRFYAREETAGPAKTTSGRAEKTDGGPGEIRRSES